MVRTAARAGAATQGRAYLARASRRATSNTLRASAAAKGAALADPADFKWTRLRRGMRL